MGRLQGKESDRYRCEYCGFPCKLGRDVEGDYGEAGWNFGDGDTTGDELLSNGSFETNATGWTAINGSRAGGVGSGQSGNCCRLTMSSGSFQYIYQALAGLTFGQMYRFTAYVQTGTSGDEAFSLRVLWNAAKTDTTLHADPYLIREKKGTSSSTWTQYTVYWRATEADNVVALVKNTSTAGTMSFDTVSVYGYNFAAQEAMTACALCGSRSWRKSVNY